VDVKSAKSFIDLRAGVPDPGILPYEAIADAAKDVLTQDHGIASQALSYPDPLGVEQLRRLIARRRQVSVDNVVITNGAMEAVFLSASAVITPGDHVLVEDPAFPQCIKIFQRLGAVLHPVPLTGEGIDIDAVEHALQSGVRFKAIYTIPDYQNPTGQVSSALTKKRLADLAAAHGVAVISDNPYQELWFDHRPDEYPVEYRGTEGSPLFEIGSFSKWLGPGLRAGWVVAPTEYVGKIASFRLGVEGGFSSLTQYAIAQLLSDDGWVEKTLQAQRRRYRSKAELLSSALSNLLEDDVSFNPVHGGYFLWARMPDWFRGDDLDAQRQLALQNINPVRGDSFFTSDAGTRYFRFSFAYEAAENLIEGVQRFKEAADAIRP
jgi:2-aminoadipate transaminase